MTNFFRFPHTPHLAWLGETPPRDDKVLSRSEVDALLAGPVTVEEKLDGANLGVSMGVNGVLRFQNRGQYLVTPYTGQFSRLAGWAAQHTQILEAVLTPGLILFGEWLAARHSISYTGLPDWFVAFDVHDAGEGGFWSGDRRDGLAGQLGLPTPPCLLRGRSSLPALRDVVTQGSSRFGAAALEGLVVRRDGKRLNEARAKLVRPGFTQAIGEHWRHRTLEWNQVGPR